MLILIVAEGPDKGRIYEWADDQTVVVGRESKQLRLSDRKASRRHARFRCEGGKWYVRDLASRHGTFVNKKRISGKISLEDGDLVQVGRTRLVVSRVPVGQAEQLARSNDLPGPTARPVVPALRRFIPSASTTAALSAAAFAVACSAWLYHNTTSENRILHDALLASQSQASTAQLDAVELQKRAAEAQLATADRTGDILAEVRALGTQSRPMLDEILASVQEQSGNTEQLSDIRQALADLHEANQPALDAILAGVQSQSQQLVALADLRDAVIQQQEDTAPLLPELRALAQTAQVNEKSLAHLRRQIELAQARPDLDAVVLDQMESVMAELRARPTTDQIDAQVRQALADEHEQTAQLLNQIESKLTPTPQTQELLAPLREALARQAQRSEQLLAQAFSRQEQTAEQLAELRTMMQSQPDQTATALRGVVGEWQIHDDLGAVLAAVKQIEAGADNPQNTALLQDLAVKLESAPTSQELANAVAQAVTQQLDGTRPLLEQIANSLTGSDEENAARQALMQQVRLALQAQEEADARLDQIYDLLESSDTGADSEALRQVLREIRSKSIAGMDEMRSTIRREIQTGMTQQRVATAQATPPPAPQVTDPGPTTAGPVPAAIESNDGYAMASPQDQDTLTITANDPPDDEALTKVERAYRLAFTTGQPISIGGGLMDTQNGAISLGRTLDPATAKAAGITDWRDWYLLDDFAERMRMQQQAVKYRDDRRGDMNILGIPADAVNTDANLTAPGPGSGG